MKLVIVHFHLRPGGIRRIIELAVPHLIREFNGTIDSVVVACGEARDRRWNAHFKVLLRGTKTEFFIEPAFNYLSEQAQSPKILAERVRAACDKLFADAFADNCLVWAHNLGIGRNLLLTRELTCACAERKVPLVSHHHDWWFDNRWLRWPEMRRCGFCSLRAVARTVFPPYRNVRHAAINQADAGILRRHLPRSSGWLPNLAEPASQPRASHVRAARRWLSRRLGDDAPVWILPCRLLRRKNIAEALLLTRWLRPDAWLVTVGGVSSADEQAYADRLAAAARKHRWRLRLGILGCDESGKPSVNELVAASEAVLLTSIQEGFGLPYLEATAARRPLIARAILNIAPDLAHFGFRFPQFYDELLVDPGLFDWEAELKRQQKHFRAWKNNLPRPCRRWTGDPVLLASGKRPRPVPFSRLTLSAQLEVLAAPPDRSWQPCAPLNPFLETWRDRAAARRLRITPSPATAARWLTGGSYASRFAKLVNTRQDTSPSEKTAFGAQADFLREKLGAEHLFPLLWSRET